MLIQFQEFLTVENIYLWTNFGILPFWIMLLLIPNSKFTLIFVNSIIIPLILASAYIYVIYKIVLVEETFIEVFKLYLNLDNLYTVFSSESFLLLFWLHFLALNIFLGSWISREGVKYNIPRGLIAIPLILTYFVGPVGLVLYWFIRIFYAKRFWLND
tara:strand:+ start:361 stop:834 length:474 start_codon:yes stop_codon:yes gene_type:complete